MKKTEQIPNIKITYDNQKSMDDDIRPGKPKIKGFHDAEAAKRKTARTGETSKQYPVRGVNDPE